MDRNYVLITVLGSALVTWLPRIFPFLLTKKVNFPQWLIDFLSYLPVCILTALLVQNLLEVKAAGFPTMKLLESISAVVTLLVAVRTKDLMKTVVVGIVLMALLRLFFA